MPQGHGATGVAYDVNSEEGLQWSHALGAWCNAFFETTAALGTHLQWSHALRAWCNRMRFPLSIIPCSFNGAMP